MVISIPARGELRSAILALIRFFTSMPPHVHFEVALLEEPQPALLTLKETYLFEVRVSLVKAESRVSRVGLVTPGIGTDVPLGHVTTISKFIILGFIVRGQVLIKDSL